MLFWDKTRPGSTQQSHLMVSDNIRHCSQRANPEHNNRKGIQNRSYLPLAHPANQYWAPHQILWGSAQSLSFPSDWRPQQYPSCPGHIFPDLLLPGSPSWPIRKAMGAHWGKWTWVYVPLLGSKTSRENSTPPWSDLKALSIFNLSSGFQDLILSSLRQDMKKLDLKNNIWDDSKLQEVQ